MDYEQITSEWINISSSIVNLKYEIDNAIEEKRYSNASELNELEEMLSSLEDISYIM